MSEGGGTVVYGVVQVFYVIFCVFDGVCDLVFLYVLVLVCWCGGLGKRFFFFFIFHFFFLTEN